MICEQIYLKDIFEELKDMPGNPMVETFIRYNMAEMGRKDDLRPAVVLLPGGGYSMVSEREGEPIAMHLLAAGYHVFILHYTCAPTGRFPDQLVQIAALMELIKQKSNHWGVDANNIGIMGFSAGGHLAAHYTNSYDCPEVRRVFPESAGVQASILCYPVITADPEYAHQGSFENLLGYFPQGAEADRFSCEKLVNEKTPPTFLWHTQRDTCVPVMNSLLYAQALAARWKPFTLHVYPYGYHGLATADRETCDDLSVNLAHNHRWLEELTVWLHRNLPHSDGKGGRTSIG